jgi:hypothetical protein
VKLAISIRVAAKAVARWPFGEPIPFMERARFTPSVSDVASKRKDCKEEAIFAARDQKLLQARETRKTKRNQHAHSLAATLTFFN